MTTILPTPAPGAVQLSPEQRAAVDAIERAIEQSRLHGTVPDALFVTGNAGTGKSTVLREARKRFNLVVVAPTGLAAINVQGETVHSMFKFGIGPKLKKDVRASSREWILRRADAIVIDEVSMVRADLMDAIHWCLQKTLKDPRPFGGKPVVFFGDMMQLEPVTGNDWGTVSDRYRSPFWFDAQVFSLSAMEAMFMEEGEEPGRLQVVNLQEIFRQQGQPEFLDSLNAIRRGDLSGLPFVNRRVGIKPPLDAPPPPTLCFTNARAEAINARHMGELGDAEERVYMARVNGEGPGEKEVPVPFNLLLRVGARVMVCRNFRPAQDDPYAEDDYGFGPKTPIVANGDCGTVLGFTNEGPSVRLDDGRVVVVPEATWEKRAYDRDRLKDSIITTIRGGFTQIPLKPAWAITVHKSQGQTLDSAMLELESSAHAHGQTYVALSRVRSFDRLYIRRPLDANDVIVRPRVLEFLGLPVPGAAPKPAVDLSAFDEAPVPPTPKADMDGIDAASDLLVQGLTSAVDRAGKRILEEIAAFGEGDAPTLAAHLVPVYAEASKPADEYDPSRLSALFTQAIKTEFGPEFDAFLAVCEEHNLYAGALL